MAATELFTFDQSGSTLTIDVHGTVSSLQNDESLHNLEHVLDQIETGAVRDVVVDFHQSPYFGSCMLETLRRIWNEIHSRGGRLVICNLSPVGREIMQVAKFDHLWPVVATRKEASDQLNTTC